MSTTTPNLGLFKYNTTTDSAQPFNINTALNSNWDIIDQRCGGTRNIGEIVESTIPLVDAGLHLLDGSLINGSGIYSAFVTHMAGLYEDNPELFTTESDWQTSVTQYGACDKFVYNSTNNTVRLPKRNNEHGKLIDSYSSGKNFYRIYSDGFCEQGGYVSNIPSDSYASVTFLKAFTNTDYHFTNQIQCNRAIGSGWDSGCADEVYTSRTTTGTEVTGDGISTTKTHYGFIWQAWGYVDISTYQQSSIYEYLIVANIVKTGITVDIDEIATDLNYKADKRDMVDCQVVVETYQNGSSWYRIWSDGWCEQGGVLTGQMSYNITFLKQFIDTSYTALVTPRYGNEAGIFNFACVNITTSGMTVYSADSGGVSNRPISWSTCGYIR